MSGPQSSGIGNSPLPSPLVSFLSQVSLGERNLACDRWFLRLSLIQYPWLHHHYVLRQGHPAPQTPGPWRLSLWQSILMLGSGLNLTVCASNLTVSAQEASWCVLLEGEGRLKQIGQYSISACGQDLRHWAQHHIPQRKGHRPCEAEIPTHILRWEVAQVNRTT